VSELIIDRRDAEALNTKETVSEALRGLEDGPEEELEGLAEVVVVSVLEGVALNHPAFRPIQKAAIPAATIPKANNNFLLTLGTLIFSSPPTS
jgi:hypothetical protein